VLLALQPFAAALVLFVLLGLSAGKSALILAWFMHLRHEKLSLTLALLPVLVTFILLLAGFLPDAGRALEMRAR
jgi:cytochrome c oxidase subunit IV